MPSHQLQRAVATISFSELHELLVAVMLQGGAMLCGTCTHAMQQACVKAWDAAH